MASAIEDAGGSSHNHDKVLSVLIEDAGGSSHNHDKMDPIEEWLSSQNSVTESTRTSIRHRIQEVPSTLRKTESNKECYDPLVVSIGPFHNGKPELQRMEQFKIPFAIRYVKRRGLSANDLYRKVEGVRKDVRSSYADYLSMEDEAFTKMMFLDGCFILQFIYCIVHGEWSEMKITTRDIFFIQRDLFLLENQLPLLILDALEGGFGKVELMIMQFIEGIWSPPYIGIKISTRLVELVVRQLDMIAGLWQSAREDEQEAKLPAHLLDMMWRQLVNLEEHHEAPYEVLDGEISQANLVCWHSYRSVQELKAAGILFKPSSTSCFTNVRYQPLLLRANLRLPRMMVNESTKSLLLNLVAYETGPGGPKGSHVASYLCFMDTLIDTAEDVKLLRKSRIIFNCLGSDEQVASLFNEMGKGLVPNSLAYLRVKNRLERHYMSRTKVWAAEWLDTYFSKPWRTLALFAATVALILTAMQSYKDFFLK